MSNWRKKFSTQQLGGHLAFQSLIPDHPADKHAVLLFNRAPQRIPGNGFPGFSGVPHPRLIVALVGTGAGQCDAGLVLLAPLFQRRVEERPVVVHIDAPQGEGQ